MQQRFVSIWFRHLNTDWFSIRQPRLKNLAFVLRTPSHGRMIVSSLNAVAQSMGIHVGMVLADARAIVPSIEALDDKPELPQRLLTRLAEWCIRFSPVVAVDLPDGILMDVTGCSHLWGGDLPYVGAITRKLKARGYDVQVSMADTIGAAWGMCRFGRKSFIIPPGEHISAISSLPPESLRLEPETVERLHKLGLHEIRQFASMPRSALKRRFGEHIIMRINMAFGFQMEMIQPVIPTEPYQERLPCLEPIVTAVGIEIAMKELLETLCLRLQKEEKGLRAANFKCYRVDGNTQVVSIGTTRPSRSPKHLYKLFEDKIQTIEPALGIELFVLEASKVEDYLPQQEKMWEGASGLDDIRLSELLDRLTNKLGEDIVHRYLPHEHYWPERSIKPALSLQEKPTTKWRTDKLRPLHLLKVPERIEVTAPIPDYPPMNFRYRGDLHIIKKADGPERIEQEWWIQQGQHRDYYRVEDEEGRRYWVFRLGHYHDKKFEWFIHGFFA